MSLFKRLQMSLSHLTKFANVTESENLQLSPSQKNYLSYFFKIVSNINHPLHRHLSAPSQPARDGATGG